MTGRIVRGVVVGLVAAAGVLMLARSIQPNTTARTVPATVSCVLLVVLAVGTWVAPWLAWRVLRRDPSVTALRDQIVRFVATGAGASGVAFLGLLYLLGLRLVDGGGLVLLLFALAALALPPYIWTVNYYRRR